MVRVEAGIDLPETHQAQDQQPGAYQQHQGQRHLGHDERFSDAPASSPGCSTPRGAFQVFVHVDGGGLPGGPKAEGQTDKYRERSREAQHYGVERHFLDAREARGRKHRQQRDEGVSQTQAQKRAEPGEQQAFGKQLPHDTYAASARKQQASHIGAGDQEHETHSAQEQHQCRTNVAHDGVLQPGQQNAQAGALRYLAAKLARNHRKIGLCLRQRETRLQPAEDIQEMVASRRHIIAGRVGNGRPYFRAGAWKLERGGHHAYDGIGFLIELDGAADHGAIAAEAPAPQVLAQDSDAVPAPFLSARRKQRAGARTR